MGLISAALLVGACGLSEIPVRDAAVSTGPAPGGPSIDLGAFDFGGGSSPPAPPVRDAGRPPVRDARAPVRDAEVRDAGAPGNGPAPRPDVAGPPPAAPPGTGDQVIIGGTPVPKEKVVVFLHIGHSNMAGRTSLPIEMRPFNFETHPRLLSFKGAMWTLAKEPLSGDYLTRSGAGPGMSILRTALTFAPGSVVVSIGHGQDGSRGGKCASYRRGALLYEHVMGPAKQLKGKVTFGGIFSMLVLMDVFGDKFNLPRAHECHEGIAADMRADLGDPNIPFLMSDWEMGAIGRFRPTTPDAMVAREQLRVAQKNITRSVIIPTDNLPMSDDHHFDLVGYKTWAERAFALIKQNGWATWATEP